MTLPRVPVYIAVDAGLALPQLPVLPGSTSGYGNTRIDEFLPRAGAAAPAVLPKRAGSVCRNLRGKAESRPGVVR